MKFIEKLKPYCYDKAYDHFDTTLETLHFTNKNEYLKILQHLDELIDLKLAEVENSLEVKQENNDKYTKIIFEEVEARIRLKINLKNLKLETKIDEIAKKCITITVLKHLVNMYGTYDMRLVNSVLQFLENISYVRDSDHHYKLFKSNVIVITLTKEFYDSGRFEKLLRNFTLLKKPIFVVKYADFDIDSNIFKGIQGPVKGVYNLNKHKEYDYDGYELRRLFADLAKEGCPLNFDVSHLENTVYSYI